MIEHSIMFQSISGAEVSSKQGKAQTYTDIIIVF